MVEKVDEKTEKEKIRIKYFHQTAPLVERGYLVEQEGEIRNPHTGLHSEIWSYESYESNDHFVLIKQHIDSATWWKSAAWEIIDVMHDKTKANERLYAEAKKQAILIKTFSEGSLELYDVIDETSSKNYSVLDEKSGLEIKVSASAQKARV